MASTSVTIRDFHTEIPGTLSDNGTTWRFPEVLATNSRGKQSSWKIYVRAYDGKSQTPLQLSSLMDNERLGETIYATHQVDTGLVGGKIRDSNPTIVKVGKNIGKKSETNVLCQALRDALSMYNKHVQGATKATTDGVTKYLPMLAKVISISDLRQANDHSLLKDDHMQKSPKSITKLFSNSPLFVQRKYNGVRCIFTRTADGSVIGYSRKGNLYPGLDHITKILKPIFDTHPKLYIDGELYQHGANLQDISGDTRRGEAQGDRSAVDYMIYDCFIDGKNETYSTRKALLDSFTDKLNNTQCKLVETFTVSNPTELLDRYNQFIGEKYEGAMIRLDAEYKYSYNNYHCNNLLKLKPSFDHEYKLVGWMTGKKGKAADALMVTCVTEKGKEFNVTPALTMEDRERMAKEWVTDFESKWKGLMITVTYDEISKDGVPQRARTELKTRVD